MSIEDRELYITKLEAFSEKPKLIHHTPGVKKMIDLMREMHEEVKSLRQSVSDTSESASKDGGEIPFSGIFELGMLFQQMIAGGSCHDGRDVQRVLTAPEFQDTGVDPHEVDGQATKGIAVIQAKAALEKAVLARKHKMIAGGDDWDVVGYMSPKDRDLMPLDLAKDCLEEDGFAFTVPVYANRDKRGSK
jgi:hypothetical protein